MTSPEISTRYGVPAPPKAAPYDPRTAAFKPWRFFLLAGMLGATAAVVVATGQSMGAIVALSLTVVAASMVGLEAYGTLLPFVSPEAVRSGSDQRPPACGAGA